MYLPENDAQLFDIISSLRIYAAMNALSALAEALDDALVLLAAEGQPATALPAPQTKGFDQA